MDYPAASSPQRLAVGDFNRDGKLDLALTGGQSAVRLLYGNGDGSFQTPVSFTSDGPFLIAAGDLNGDHAADLAVTSYNGVSVLLNTGAQANRH